MRSADSGPCGGSPAYGDGDKKLLIAPMWSADKKHVLNRIRKEVLNG